MSRWNWRKEAYILMKEFENELGQIDAQDLITGTKPDEVLQAKKEEEILQSLTELLKGQVRGKTELTGLTVLINGLTSDVSIQIRLK